MSREENEPEGATNFDFELEISGATYYCEGVWNPDRIPDTSVACHLEEGSFPLSLKKTARGLVPLEWRRLAPGAFQIPLESEALESFILWKRGPDSQHAPPEGWVEKMTESEVRKHLVGDEPELNRRVTLSVPAEELSSWILDAQLHDNFEEEMELEGPKLLDGVSELLREELEKFTDEYLQGAGLDY
jgi:hypothetical protein